MTIKLRVDQGATLIYSHGGATDAHMMNGGKIDVIGQMVDLIKAQGVPAGVGGHSLNMPMACEKNKLNPDFYVKTFHMDRYWSATPKERRKEYDWMGGHADDHDANNDNMWCNNPEETAAFMETVDKPWVAFKVMAAGAIPPRMAFPLRLSPRGRFRHRRHVRLPGRDRREDRHRELADRSAAANGPGAAEPRLSPLPQAGEGRGEGSLKRFSQTICTHLSPKGRPRASVGRQPSP